MVLAPPKNGWSLEWPTQDGWYWFYGHDFDPTNSLKPRLSTAYVSNKMTICRGNFMYKNDAGDGVWRPIEMPPPPYPQED